MLVNDITDRYHEWPMYEQQFNTYVNEKYDNPDGVHHYEISQSSGDSSTKIEVYANEALYTGDTDFYNSATIVTNREYEEREQDRKRQIRLLDPRFVDQFVDEYEQLIGESII
jgi:tRNA U34 2-thiouridine synthase MnmA/TrmU